MRIEQTDQRIRIVFSDTPVANRAWAECSVVDLDRDRDFVVGIEVACLLSLLRARGVQASMPETVSAPARYDRVSDGLHVPLNRDQNPQFPSRNLHAPPTGTHILLSATGEIVGVEVDLPPEKPWPASPRRPRLILAHGIGEGPTDGLSSIQRAILTYLWHETEPTRCSRLIDDLMSDADRPAEVTPAAIDATLLTMAHPYVCSHPVLEYLGNPGSSDGWIPGSVYRMVSLGILGRGLVRESGVSARPWSQDALPLRLPYGLLFGSASWLVEVDQRIPEDKASQAGLRIRCTAVHCIGSRPHDVRDAAQQLRSAGDLRGALTTLGPDGPPLGCYSAECEHAAHLLAEGGEFDASTVSVRHHGALPHGVWVGAEVQPRDGDAVATAHLLSLPLLTVAGQSSGAAPSNTLIVVQPACSRHLGHEVMALRRLGGCRVRDAEGTVVIETEGGLDVRKLAERVLLVPLPPLAYSRMLAGME